MGIFEPYRAIGYITSSVPFSVQRLGTENFVTVSVGKAFHIYNVCTNSQLISSFACIRCNCSKYLKKIIFLFRFCSALSWIWSLLALNCPKKSELLLHIVITHSLLMVITLLLLNAHIRYEFHPVEKKNRGLFFFFSFFFFIWVIE